MNTMLKLFDINSIREFYKSVTDRAVVEVTNTGNLAGAHLRAIKHTMEDYERQAKEMEPEIEKQKKEAARILEIQTEAKRIKIEMATINERNKLKKLQEEIESQKTALAAERLEIIKMRDEVIARELEMDLQEHRAFQRTLLRPNDIIQINPEYGTDFAIRGCFGVVTNIMPDGTPRFYIPSIGKDRATAGDASFRLINSKWCEKVGVTQWPYQIGVR